MLWVVPLEFFISTGPRIDHVPQLCANIVGATNQRTLNLVIKTYMFVGIPVGLTKYSSCYNAILIWSDILKVFFVHACNVMPNRIFQNESSVYDVRVI